MLQVVLVIVLVLATGAVAAAMYVNASSGEPVQAAAVIKGSIREFVDERGKTRLPETHLITTPYAGRVNQIDLREGATVNAGQVLARISPIDVGADVDETTLVQIAGTDERYYYAPDSADLARIYGESAVDLMCPGMWAGR